MSTVIYWLEGGQPRHQKFPEDGLVPALKFSEELRARRRHGEDVSFVTSCSEFENSVGQAGVDVTGPDYDWKKRRE